MRILLESCCSKRPRARFGVWERTGRRQPVPPEEVESKSNTHDRRYLAIGSAERIRICSKNLLKSNTTSVELSDSFEGNIPVELLFSLFGDELGIVCGGVDIPLESTAGTGEFGAGPPRNRLDMDVIGFVLEALKTDGEDDDVTTGLPPLGEPVPPNDLNIPPREKTAPEPPSTDSTGSSAATECSPCFGDLPTSSVVRREEREEAGEGSGETSDHSVSEVMSSRREFGAMLSPSNLRVGVGGREVGCVCGC